MASIPSAFQVKVLSNISQGIDSIYNDRLLCDLRVTVGHVTFDCHRLVMAAVSGFFQGLMSAPWQESQTGQVKIEHEDVTTESFQMLLDILYKNEEVITEETVKDVLRMSIFLQVKFLEEHCLEFLDTNITPDVCAGTWMFAEKYQLPTLAQTAATMASDQTDQVMKSDDFLQLPKAMLLIILGSQKKLSMDDLCRFILRWVEKEPESRQAYLSELLPFVSFPQLSPVCISELMNYFDHPLRKYMAKSINDAVLFNLVNQQDDLKLQILARQDRVATSPLIQKCAVVIGGCKESNAVLNELSAFRVKPGKILGTYPLKPSPESCGIHFATCVWKNELYVSGGSQRGAFFAKYKSCYNDWEVLPDMTHGFERHAMAAVNGNIYVVGGLSMLKKKKPSSFVHVYDVSKKCWSKLRNELPVAILDADAAVLGHRIYVFGGKNTSKKPSDVVQCLDTTSGLLYKAGKLPLPAGEIVALSDGGTIYLMCDGTKVLKMRELFDIADEKERQAKDQKAEKTTVASKDQEVQATDTSKDTEDQATDTSKDKEDQAFVIKDDLPSTVRFKEVGAFADDKMLSAYLHNGEMVACGSKSLDGALQPVVKAMNLATGDVSNQRQQLGERLKNFGMQTLNIPAEYLDQETLVGQFQVGDQVRLKEGVPFPHSSVTVGTVQNIKPTGHVTVTFSCQSPENNLFGSLQHVQQSLTHCTPAKNLCLQ